MGDRSIEPRVQHSSCLHSSHASSLDHSVVRAGWGTRFQQRDPTNWLQLRLLMVLLAQYMSNHTAEQPRL